MSSSSIHCMNTYVSIVCRQIDRDFYLRHLTLITHWFSYFTPLKENINKTVLRILDITALFYDLNVLPQESTLFDLHL